MRPRPHDHNRRSLQSKIEATPSYKVSSIAIRANTPCTLSGAPPMTDPYGQPRILRAKHAPSYLGMCRAEFDKTVRPHVSEFPIGKQGVGFDRLELDAWADAYIAAHSNDKKTRDESSSLPTVTPQSRSKKSGALAGSATDKASYKAPTSEDFYRLVDEILGRSADKKDRRQR